MWWHGGDPRHDVLLRHPAVCAIVHHGGAGTVAAAAAAGVPQIVCPAAYDQFRWAERVLELGLGPRGAPVDDLVDRGAGGESALASSAVRALRAAFAALAAAGVAAVQPPCTSPATPLATLSAASKAGLADRFGGGGGGGSGGGGCSSRQRESAAGYDMIRALAVRAGTAASGLRWQGAAERVAQQLAEQPDGVEVAASMLFRWAC